jgi:hypothetical protein
MSVRVRPRAQKVAVNINIDFKPLAMQYIWRHKIVFGVVRLIMDQNPESVDLFGQLLSKRVTPTSARKHELLEKMLSGVFKLCVCMLVMVLVATGGGRNSEIVILFLAARALYDVLFNIFLPSRKLNRLRRERKDTPEPEESQGMTPAAVGRGMAS